MPQNAAQAGRAIAANPQNAAAIVNQLTNNPANRTAPPAYWFMLMNHQASNQPAHDAMTLAHRDQVAKNPANQQANAAFDLMLTAQGQAAQQDIAIGLEIERLRRVNQLLEERLALDVQLLESTNQGINQFNERALPVLQAITGMSLGLEPEKWRAWWTDQLGYAYKSDVARNQTDLHTISLRWFRRRYTVRVSPAGTLVQTMDGPAADRVDPDRRSGLVAGHFDREPSRFNPCWPPISIRLPRRFGSRSAVNRSSPPAFTASGRRARAGRWPAS